MIRMKLAAAAAAALCAFTAMPLTAHAVDYDTIAPVYPLDQPAAAKLTLIPPADESFSVTIAQHSPERESLVLYDAKIAAEKGHRYVMMLEPGDYTVTYAAARFADGGVQTAEQTLHVENPDFAEDIDTARITVTMKFGTLPDTETAEPVLTEDSVTREDGLDRKVYTLSFFRYERLRGDWDGDGAVMPVDVMQVMKEANRQLLEEPLTGTKGQFAACDIDGNGQLDARDVLKMLRYSNKMLVDDEASWDEI
jgi:hypothetical protein